MVSLNTETYKIDAKAIRKGRKAVEKKAKQLERLDVTYVPVTDVIPNDYNPNRQSDHDFELLCRSMTEDGFTQPVVVVKSKDGVEAPYTVVDGEHRWRAAQAIGLTEIPIVVTPMTLEQAKIATLRHNRARGSEDVELSAALLRDLRDLGQLDWAKDSLMLDEVELDRLLEDIPVTEILAGDEYEQAWEPGTEEVGDEGTVRELVSRTEGMSPAALETLRRQRERIAAAKTAEERAAIRKDREVYRISLTFADHEADIVRRVLGNNPAQRVYELCAAADVAMSHDG